MTNSLENSPFAAQPRSQFWPMLAVGACTFVIGGAAVFGAVQWQAQKQELAAMTAIVAQLQQQQSTPQPQPEILPTATVAVESPEDIATRNASLDLLAVASAATSPAPQEEVVAASADAALPRASAANQIRAIASRAADPMVARALATDTQRREAMSAAIAGVNELAAVAASGRYNVQIDANAEQGAIVQLDFIGHEARQQEIENLLRDAVLRDEIAFDKSVLRNDGSVDADLLLLSLVQRSLLNGTPSEQAVGADIRAKVAEIATLTDAPETTQEAGERFYTVEPGDSLAYIALQFYGDTNAYRAIFDANRTILLSPDRIQIGQRLRIPNA